MQYYTKISANYKRYTLNFSEVLKYRDLIDLFVRRDFKVRYAQTILGPLWLILTPLLTSVVYFVVFGGILGVSVSGIPKMLFYLLSNSLWVYMSSCITNNSRIFVENAQLFGKVYFPRLIVPIAKSVSNLVLLGIQMLIVIPFLVYHAYTGEVHPYLVMLPLFLVCVIVLGILGTGLGVLTSSLTSKYRDLSMLITFIVTLLMYITPVIYTSEMIKNPLVKNLLWLNPATPVFELSRYILFGNGEVRIPYLIYSVIASLAIFILSALLFNKTEKTFMDTV